MARLIFQLRSTRIALGFAFVLGGTLCFLPLVSVLGPESSLVLGLLLSPGAALVALRLGRAAQRVRTAELMAAAVGTSWLLLALPTGLFALNALRGTVCDPWSGLAFVALGAWPSVTLAAVWGVAASTVPRAAWAVTLALAAPALGIARALYDFVTGPGIFAFGHLFGYFPGTLYDRQIDVPTAWYSQRLIGTILGAGLWAFVAAARDPRSSTLRMARLERHPLLALLVAICGGAVFIASRESHALGHTTSSRHAAHSLGLVLVGPRCRVAVPRELERGEAQRIAEECELRVTQLERALQIHEAGPLHVYFFRSAHEKRALMGAARVYIAKPWRSEAYLQLSGFPHPVLGHELAHVVARQIARGPFGVPGKLYGLVPEPTLVEGLAVALDPTARDELTPHQWAKAAYAAHVAPPLKALLGPGFLAHNAALAYTLSGSFLRYVLEVHGPDRLRRIYQSGDVAGTLGQSFEALEAAWQTWLANVPLPEQAAALAELRFERPGVFAQVCPHQIETLEQELGAALASNDLSRAQQRCDQLLAIDPGLSDTRATCAGTLARAGQFKAAHQQLAALVGPPASPKPIIARARAMIADAYVMRGDYPSAHTLYQALLREPQPEHDLRQLEVKLLGLEAPEPTRSLLAELLIGQGGKAPDARTAMHLIHRLAHFRRDGLALYLEGRQLFAAGRYDLARPRIERAIAQGLPTVRLAREAQHMAAIASFVVGALDAAEAHAHALAANQGSSLAQQNEARDLGERAAFRRSLLQQHGQPTHAHKPAHDSATPATPPR